MVSPVTDRRLGLAGNTGVKAPVTVVATSNITQSGEQTIDGIAVKALNAAGVPDRVLCTAQTDGTTNGIWDVQTSGWTRSADADGTGDLANGTQVLVARGSAAKQVWVLTSSDPITVGTTSQTWSLNLSSGFLATLAASGGGALVGYIGSTTGETATTLGAMLNLTVKGLKKHFGAVGDGVTNDRTAINNAIGATGKIIEVENGTFLYNSALGTATCAGIVGWGDAVSILQPGVGLTKGLSLVTNGPRILRDFRMDGSLCTAATGITVGDGSSMAMMMQNVRIYGFSTGVGLRVDNALKSKFQGITSEGNAINMLIQQSTVSSLPTTLYFDSCVFTSTSIGGTYGVKIVDGTGILFENCDFESSKSEGMLIDTSSGRDVLDVTIGEGCWFEANNSAGGSSSYHLTVSSNTGARTVRVFVRGAFFDVGNATYAQRAIQMTGQDIRGFVIEHPNLSTDRGAETISVKNGALGRIVQWPLYLGYTTNVVVDTTSFDYGPYGDRAFVRYPKALSTISGSSSIAVSEPVSFVSSSATVATITASAFGNAGGRITLIPSGATPFITSTAGNIAVATTGTVRYKAIDFVLDKGTTAGGGSAGTALWYPSM